MTFDYTTHTQFKLLANWLLYWQCGRLHERESIADWLAHLEEIQHRRYLMSKHRGRNTYSYFDNKLSFY